MKLQALYAELAVATKLEASNVIKNLDLDDDWPQEAINGALDNIDLFLEQKKRRKPRMTIQTEDALTWEKFTE